MGVEVPHLEKELFVLMKHVVDIEVLDPVRVQVVVDNFSFTDRLERGIVNSGVLGLEGALGI